MNEAVYPGWKEGRPDGVIIPAEQKLQGAAAGPALAVTHAAACLKLGGPPLIEGYNLLKSDIFAAAYDGFRRGHGPEFRARGERLLQDPRKPMGLGASAEESPGPIPSTDRGKAGDLYLEIVFKPHQFYRPDGKDIHLDLPVTPWEAALGATVKVPTPIGSVDLKIPAGTGNDKKLRLKGRGIPGSPPGDFYVTTEITLPSAKSDAEKEIYAKMQQEMPYNPREHLEVSRS